MRVLGLWHTPGRVGWPNAHEECGTWSKGKDRLTRNASLRKQVCCRVRERWGGRYQEGDTHGTLMFSLVTSFGHLIASARGQRVELPGQKLFYSCLSAHFRRSARCWVERFSSEFSALPQSQAGTTTLHLLCIVKKKKSMCGGNPKSTRHWTSYLTTVSLSFLIC